MPNKVDRSRTKYCNRFYNTPPEQMTVEMCRTHGTSHRQYGWNPQPDGRWSDEQYVTYMNAYDSKE